LSEGDPNYRDPDLTELENRVAYVVDDHAFRSYNKGHWAMGGAYRHAVFIAKRVIAAFPELKGESK